MVTPTTSGLGHDNDTTTTTAGAHASRRHLPQPGQRSTDTRPTLISAIPEREQRYHGLVADTSEPYRHNPPEPPPTRELNSRRIAAPTVNIERDPSHRYSSVRSRLRRPSISAASIDSRQSTVPKEDDTRPRTSPNPQSTAGPAVPSLPPPHSNHQAQEFLSRLPPFKLKRAPASWSSNGIETSQGPPPALTTVYGRRVKNIVLTRSNTEVQLSRSRSSSPASQYTDCHSDRASNSPPKEIRPSLRMHPAGMGADVREGVAYSYGEGLPERDDRTLRALEGLAAAGANGAIYGGHVSRDERLDLEQAHSREDLFLNLARVDLSREGVDDPSRPERRRVSRLIRLTTFTTD